MKRGPMRPPENESFKGKIPETEKSALRLYQESRLAQKRLNTMLKFLPDPVFAFNLENKVEYINPAFERVFGWTLEEVRGQTIRFIPEHLIDEARKGMKQLFLNRSVLDFETQRLTKDGRILDIVINGSILYNENDEPIGQVLILRDRTVEKRMAKTNQIMFRISEALHSYQELGDLIERINREIQNLIGVEGAFILLADQETEQLYFLSAQYRDRESEKKFKKIKFQADQGVSGHVYTTARPLVIPDVSQCSFFLRRVDDETGMVSRNMMSVPIRLKDRTIGVISVVNKAHGDFDAQDVDLLSMVASTVALPIENTRIHEELRKSYQDLKTLNHAKDKVINHLAHELKTPVSILGASMTLLSRKLKALAADNDQMDRILKRGQRNLQRILDIQYEVEDLLKDRHFKAYHALNRLLDVCVDELESLIELETENSGWPDRIRETLEKLFHPEAFSPQTVHLDTYLSERLQRLEPKFAHRNCLLDVRLEKTDPVHMPVEVLDILTRGIIRNAVEYTPDGGKIEIVLETVDQHPELVVRDYGIGMTLEKQRLLFENFFSPPESTDYSTKKSYDFNAGGRGFDLLRIKLFSERYPYTLWIASDRCPAIPDDGDVCPGDIRRCPACPNPDDCFRSGGTAVHIRFD